MTSPMTHEATVAYFEECNFFGLAREDVFFFQQGTLPCLTEGGKIIMETPSRVARAPDGNGGIYLALHRSGALADMESRGIEYLHCYCVDNAVSPMPDPHFIGYCLTERADVGAKVVYKAHPHEKVGVVALRGGRPAVVEYSEISDEVAERKGEDGALGQRPAGGGPVAGALSAASPTPPGAPAARRPPRVRGGQHLRPLLHASLSAGDVRAREPAQTVRGRLGATASSPAERFPTASRAGTPVVGRQVSHGAQEDPVCGRVHGGNREADGEHGHQAGVLHL